MQYLSDNGFIVIFVSPEESHVFFVFFDDSKIWDSEGFLKFRLSDASDFSYKSN